MLIREKNLFFKNRPSLRREANLNENGGILTLNALNVIYTSGPCVDFRKGDANYRYSRTSMV